MLQHHSCASAAAAYWPPDVINNVLLKLLPPHKLLPLWPWVPCNSSLNESSSILSCTGLDTGGPLSFSKQHTCFFFAKEPHFGLSDYLPQKALKQLLINLGNFISFFFLAYCWFILLCKFLLYSKVNQAYIHISLLFEFPLHSGHTEQWGEFLVLYSRFFFISYLFYT